MSNTYRYVVEAGALVRGALRRRLREMAFECRVAIYMKEDMGLLSSQLYGHVKGAPRNVATFQQHFEALMRHGND